MGHAQGARPARAGTGTAPLRRGLQRHSFETRLQGWLSTSKLSYVIQPPSSCNARTPLLTAPGGVPCGLAPTCVLVTLVSFPLVTGEPADPSCAERGKPQGPADLGTLGPPPTPELLWELPNP